MSIKVNYNYAFFSFTESGGNVIIKLKILYNFLLLVKIIYVSRTWHIYEDMWQCSMKFLPCDLYRDTLRCAIGEDVNDIES